MGFPQRLYVLEVDLIDSRELAALLEGNTTLYFLWENKEAGC